MWIACRLRVLVMLHVSGAICAAFKIKFILLTNYICIKYVFVSYISWWFFNVTMDAPE